MFRRPPRSTLFPTRRSSDLGLRLARLVHNARAARRRDVALQLDHERVVPRDVQRLERRSEEHTSELQSLTNLVCRLLLEKKKKNKLNKQTTNNAHHSQ